MSLPFIPTSEINEDSTQERGYQLPLDLNRLLINRPASTFLLCSATERHGVQTGDILVVDRSASPRHGQLVVAADGGDLELARFPVAEIWGVVIYVIHDCRS